jgi:hypothetical protein
VGEFPWIPGAATSVGSLPGTDPREAARLVFGELPDLPHVPELPGRGPGADLIGRAAALLVDIAVDMQPTGWRAVDRPGADQRRAVAYLREDLDALEEAAEGYQGPLKLQVVGPLTLAASLERARGDRLVADAGARRDLAQSLSEGVQAHIGEIRKRLPGVDLLLQVDEPSLPAVLAGAIPTMSGLGRLPTVEETEVIESLRRLLNTPHAYRIVHCCAPDVPVAVLGRAGAQTVSFDLSLLGDQVDAYASAADDGMALWPGVVPSARPQKAAVGPRSNGSSTRQPQPVRMVRDFWRRLGLDDQRGRVSTVITPTCGLAGADPDWARQALRLVREAGRALAERADG